MFITRKAIHVPKLLKKKKQKTTMIFLATEKKKKKNQSSLHRTFFLLWFIQRFFSLLLAWMNTQSSLQKKIIFSPSRLLTRIYLLFHSLCLPSFQLLEQTKNIYQTINLKMATYYICLFLLLQNIMMFYHRKISIS